jgi:glycosyltransferase involved in cell wall biosynthesis
MITHNYPRHAGDVAGAFIGRLARALVARGTGVSVVAPADRGTARRFTDDGVDVVQVRYAAPERETLAYTGRLADAVRSVGGLRALRGLLQALTTGARDEARRIGARLMHAHWWVPGGWAATRTGLPCVVTLHGTDVDLLRRWPARALGRRVLRRAGAVTAVSTYLAQRTHEAVGRGDVDVIPLPLDTARYDRASRGGGGVAVLGRLTKQKRLDLVLRALHHGRIAAPVTIIGDGPERVALERLAAALGLAHVRFSGAVPPERVPDALGDADVLAFPAVREGLGLAAAEALLLGIPVVACEDGGGLLDLVRPGEGGLIVPPQPAPLAAALRQCLTDPAARAAAVRAAVTLRHRLAPMTAAAAFERVYARVA